VSRHHEATFNRHLETPLARCTSGRRLDDDRPTPLRPRLNASVSVHYHSVGYTQPSPSSIRACTSYKLCLLFCQTCRVYVILEVASLDRRRATRPQERTIAGGLQGDACRTPVWRRTESYLFLTFPLQPQYGLFVFHIGSAAISVLWFAAHALYDPDWSPRRVQDRSFDCELYFGR
jgi:hypothetical protein